MVARCSGRAAQQPLRDSSGDRPSDSATRGAGKRARRARARDTRATIEAIDAISGSFAHLVGPSALAPTCRPMKAVRKEGREDYHSATGNFGKGDGWLGARKKPATSQLCPRACVVLSVVGARTKRPNGRRCGTNETLRAHLRRVLLELATRLICAAYPKFTASANFSVTHFLAHATSSVPPALCFY